MINGVLATPNWWHCWPQFRWELACRAPNVLRWSWTLHRRSSHRHLDLVEWRLSGGMIDVSAMLTCRSLAIEDPAMNHVNSWKAWSTTPADESRSSWGPLKIQFTFKSFQIQMKQSKYKGVVWVCVCVVPWPKKQKHPLQKHQQKYINHHHALFTTNPPILSQGWLPNLS